MANLKNLVAGLQAITGVARKQGRALREIDDLLKSLYAFMEEFGEAGKVFAGDNVVRARVDVSSLMHKIRTSERIFKQAGKKQLTPLIMDVYDRLESVRMDVYNPRKGKVSLPQSLAVLQDAIGALAGAVAAADSG